MRLVGGYDFFLENSYIKVNFQQPTLEGVDFQRIRAADNLLLNAPITEEEIKEEVWGCDRNKRLGPDGFNLRFLKNITLKAYLSVGLLV